PFNKWFNSRGMFTSTRRRVRNLALSARTPAWDRGTKAAAIATTTDVGACLHRPGDIGMGLFRSRALLRYAAGMLGIFFAAWLSGVTHSMVPLALGASAALMCTASLVKAIWTKVPTR